MKRNSCCSFCPNTIESSIHVLRDCPYAREMWSKLQVDQNFYQNDCVAWVSSNLEKTTSVLGIPWYTWFPFILWRIWIRRNKWCFDKKSMQIDLFWKETVWQVQEFFYSRPIHQPPQPLSPHQNQQLRNTPYIIVDASFSLSNLDAGLAGLLFDHSQQWARAFVKKMSGTEATEMEIQVIKEAGQWAQSMGWTDIHIFSDSSIAVQGINGENTLLDKYTNQCKSCREHIGTTMKVEWSKRENLRVADLLAKAARKANLQQNSFYEISRYEECNNNSDPLSFWISFLEGLTPLVVQVDNSAAEV